MSMARPSIFSSRLPPSSSPSVVASTSSGLTALSSLALAASFAPPPSSALPWTAAKMRPWTLLMPTATASSLPLPVITDVPESTKGSRAASASLATSTGSPVRADSSIFTSVPSRRMPSAAMTSPTATRTTSPTTMSRGAISAGLPPRTTETSASDSSSSCWRRNSRAFVHSMDAWRLSTTATVRKMATPSMDATKRWLGFSATIMIRDTVAQMMSACTVLSSQPSRMSSQ
mmetsp:Transcript_5503/g.18708  ORF Transcript_5503/g.18708 Transcript_5503/m.18708 type:complete len:231 (-) Transcript_5503:369-1061(-)